MFYDIPIETLNNIGGDIMCRFKKLVIIRDELKKGENTESLNYAAGKWNLIF